MPFFQFYSHLHIYDLPDSHFDPDFTGIGFRLHLFYYGKLRQNGGECSRFSPSLQYLRRNRLLYIDNIVTLLFHPENSSPGKRRVFTRILHLRYFRNHELCYIEKMGRYHCPHRYTMGGNIIRFNYLPYLPNYACVKIYIRKINVFIRSIISLSVRVSSNLSRGTGCLDWFDAID